MWIVGMMGSGKNTVGRLAARQLDVAFFDTNLMVSRRAGASIPEIWADVGEPGFRELESHVMREVPVGNVIAAAGGGATLDPANRQLMASQGSVVWLRCAPSSLAARLTPYRHRLLLAGSQSPGAELERLAENRAPVYREVSTHEVATTGLTIDEVVEKVVRLWQS